MPSVLRLVCFVALFVMLCITGGELCASGPSGFLPGFLGPDWFRDRRDPGPVRPREEAFRGLSPVPGLGDRLLPQSGIRSGSGRHAG